MGTWISHLRIADKLLDRLTEVDSTAFIFGSLAPDSGVPNDDWSEYDPPKQITHFLVNGPGENNIHDLDFFRQYLQNCDRKAEPEIYSFRLGYFFHLVCDRLWAERIGTTSRESYPDLFASHSEADAWNLIKKDWYDLDHLYLQRHPDFNPWQIYLTAPIPQISLPYLDQAAYESQVAYIRGFYTDPANQNGLERPYPYMNETTMETFVTGSANSLLKIRRLMLACPPPEGLDSAVRLLPSTDTAPLQPPLGDPAAEN